MACLRCRLKPISKNQYGTLIEYTAPLPETELDPVVFALPPLPELAGLFRPEARVCRCCGNIYCELHTSEPAQAKPAGKVPSIGSRR